MRRKSFLDEILLIKAIRAIDPRRDRGVLVFFVAIGIATSLSLAVPFSKGLTSELIAAHHFRPKSWPAWGAIQLLPKMYSFAHTCWIGQAPLLDQQPISTSEARFARESFWVNHYPARRARFDGGRRDLGIGAVRYIYVRTRYFGYQETTRITARVSSGQLALDIERRQEEP